MSRMKRKKKPTKHIPHGGPTTVPIGRSEFSSFYGVLNFTSPLYAIVDSLELSSEETEGSTEYPLSNVERGLTFLTSNHQTHRVHLQH